MLAEIVEELAPTGVLRAAINMSNFLLVTGKTDDGDPVGVSPDMAGELAKRLGVGLELLKYKTPGEVADDAGKGIWDIHTALIPMEQAQQCHQSNYTGHSSVR